MPERWIQLMRKSTFIPKSTSCWAAIHRSNRASSTTCAQPVVESTPPKKVQMNIAPLNWSCDQFIIPLISSRSVNTFCVNDNEHIIHSWCGLLMFFFVFFSQFGLWSPDYDLHIIVQLVILARLSNWSKMLKSWRWSMASHGLSDLDLHLGR